MEILVSMPGRLRWSDQDVPCALGSAGIRAQKKEGDGATPAGAFPLRAVLYRPDRLGAPKTRLPLRALRPEDGWCDDPGDPRYNTLIERPFGASFEPLWRDDGLYDLLVVLGHNDDPPKPNLGSAIFMHVAKPGFEPTEGCIALGLADLRALIGACGERAVLRVA